jgi:Fic family protein
MKPPYDLTTVIVKLVASISGKIGEVNANYLSKPSPQLRKENQIKTIHASLGIEGNSLSVEQVTALLDNKPVIGPPKDILEVQNAIQVYELLRELNPFSPDDFLNAHKLLLSGLIARPGVYRKEGVGIVQGEKVMHMAPPHGNVPYLMNDLFAYIKNDEEHVLIKSCVFHYEMEFIHPFMDGNGRMGRLWQTVILSTEFPVFAFLPFETLISADQEAYYEALAQSDKSGKSTIFIEYMLNVIDRSLSELLSYNNRTLTDTDRLEYFLHLGHTEFTRRDYMNVFKDISSATASRDLKKGVEEGLLEKEGELNRTVYKVNKS